MKNKIFIGLLVMVLVIASFTGCTPKTTNDQTATDNQTVTEDQTTQNNTTDGSEQAAGPVANGSIILATTTSTRDSGLLDYILPDFTEKTGIEVKTVAVGTGKALQMGVDGEADVLLVHAKSSEEAFVANGDGTARYDVMYNDFVIIGPNDDPAQLSEKANNDVLEAFKILSEGNYTFISRGDDSGTNKKEIAIWQDAGIEPSGDWYVSAGKGMGDVIQMTNEMLGYTLTDRATYLHMKDDLDLKVVVEGDPNLFNQYGVIPVNPNKNDQINSEGAQAFVNWILSDETQALISGYGVEEFGQPLFTPNAQKK